MSCHLGDHRILTKEEKRVVIYSKDEKPTVPEEVTHNTPLESLNLNWRERNLPERIRTKHVHRLHPYLGKFIPQLVEIFLRKYFSSGQTVLDPFCGSGTTLVQANELGINSIGCDISAFNVLLCRAKTTKYNPVKVRKEILDILEKVRSATQDNNLTLWPTKPTYKPSKTDNQYLMKWFAPQALRELLAYRYFIENGDYEYKDLLRVILSRSARSARLTTHYDLEFPKKPQMEPYWCYKHSRNCQPTTEVFKFIRRYSLDTIRRIKEFSAIRTDSKVIVHHGDSRTVSLQPIDGVITSPPYVGLIDYHEQHAYAYNLLGLEDNREREIGPAANGSSIKAKKEYQEDIAKVFKNVVDYMPSGGRLMVIAGDKDNLYGEIAELAGVEVENIIQRHVNRRTGRRANEFYESVFICRKS